jgi:hypothetical protein
VGEQMNLDDIKKDAEEWGPALNEAAWSVLVAHGKTERFNDVKSVVRASILSYLKEIRKREGK